MKKRFYAILAAFLAVTVNVHAVEYSVMNATGGIVISGNTDHIGDNVNVTVYDKSNNLLYVDQIKTAETTDFEFRAAVEEQTGLKIKVGGKSYSPTVKYTEEDEEDLDILYVSNNNLTTQDGSRTNPYSTISDAFLNAEDGDKIFVMDEMDWDSSVNGSKKVVFTGSKLCFSDNTVILPDITFEKIKIEVPEGASISANDLTVGKNVKFSNPVNISANTVDIRSGEYNNITAEKVIISEYAEVSSVTDSALVIVNKNSSISTDVCTNCKYVLKVNNGGDANIKDGKLIITPEDERVVSIDSGAYAKNATVSQQGVYDVNFDYDFKLHSVNIYTDVSGYSAKVELSAYNRNNDLKKAEPMLLCAWYNTNNALISAKTERLATGVQDSISLSLGKILDDDFTVKFFIWDSFGGMSPLCEIMITGYEEKNEYAYYVAPNGSDTNAGTFAEPFKTIQAAISAAKNKSMPTTIYLKEGTYNISSGIALDSNCENITIKSYNNEKAVITTAYEIKGSDFNKITDTITESIINTTAKEKVLVANLAELGITEISEICDYSNNALESVAPVLMQDEKRMELAKYPDTGYLKIGNSASGGNGTTAMNFTISGGLSIAQNWSGENIYADGYIAQDWRDSRAEVTLSNVSSNCVVTAKDNTLPIVPVSGKRVRFINVPEEISVPGEWYLDYDNNKLYVYPYDNFSDDSTITLNSNKSNIAELFKLNGCSNITFEGIEFKNIGTTAMNLIGADTITVKNCHFINIMGECIKSTESNNMIIKNNEFEYLSGGAVTLHGGDGAKLIKSNNLVTNNEIHDFSLDRRTYTPAIEINGCGNTVSHNEIYNSPHMAIGIHGIAFTIEYNDIYNVCNDTSDSGAIYSGQRVHLVDNKITNNYFHDIKNKIGMGYAVNAVYFDDLWSSCEVSKNIFYDVDRGCLVGGGRSNNINNNIFIDSDDSIKIDSRGNSIKFEEHRAYVNLYYSPAGENKSEVWLREFPEVCNILNDQPAKAKYNSVYNNICVSTSTPNIEFTPRYYAKKIANNVSASESKIKGAFYDYDNGKFEVVNKNTLQGIVSDFEIFDFNMIGILK